MYNIKRKTAESIVWNIIGRGSTSATSFVIFVVLARLLTPSEFGIFSLAQVFVEVTRIVASSGWTDAIVRETDPTDELLDTAFWANLALGILIAGVALVVAKPYADFTGQGDVLPLLWWLAPLVPVSCLSSIHIGRALHAFGYRELALRTFLSNLFAGVAAVTAAWRGCGVWSLVIQAVIADVTLVLSAWLIFPWIPGTRVSRQHLRSLLGFTSAMTATQILWLLLGRVPDVFISRYLGAAAVGSYRIGFRMFDLLSQLIVQPVAGVGLTTFSRLRDSSEATEAAFVRIISLLALVIFPTMGGFAVLAPDVIPAFFGDKWQSSIAVTQIFMAMMVPFLLGYFDVPIFAAAGRVSSMTKIAGVQLGLVAVASYVLSPLGIPYVATAYVICAYLKMPYQQYLMYRDAGIRFSRLLPVISLPLFGTSFMCLLLILFRYYIDLSSMSIAFITLLEIIVGLIAYATFMSAVGRRAIISHYRFLVSIRSSDRPTV